MCICGAFNSAMWIYAAWRPGVMRADIDGPERWTRALSTVTMPVLFLVCLFLDKSQIIWIMPIAGVIVFVIRRVILPRYRSKAVENAT
jgi:hypothetical protein